jgi:hypothetical protein
MNYYNEIKSKLIDNEVYSKVKDYSKERHKVITYFEIGKLLKEAGGKYGDNIIDEYSKKLVIEVGKKKVINYVVSKCLGPNFFDIVVKELKKFVKKISNKFSNKLKKILNEKYSAQIKQMIIFDTIDQNSSWGKYLSTQLKIALKCLSRILNLFVKTILNLKIVL